MDLIHFCFLVIVSDGVGATLLANAGIPSNMIQLMGDWKSDAYKKYIVNDLSDRLKVANKIKKFICQER